jgi:two-component system response regulator YesN
MYKLYIADDELIIINGLKKLLNWQDLQCEIVGESNNGKKAEEEIVKLKPDIAILDIRMPFRSGLQILKTINEHELHTKVVFLSAYAEFDYAQEALNLGAANYLTKPVNSAKLETAVKEAVKHIEADANAREALDRVKRMEINQNPGSFEWGRNTIKDFIRVQPDEQIRKILLYMSDHCAEDITLKKIASIAYMNPFYFSVFFKKNVGIKFKECLTRIRMERAMSIFLKENLKTWELGEMVGFTDPQYFSSLFKKYYGKTPMEIKKKSAAERGKEISCQQKQSC